MGREREGGGEEGRREREREIGRGSLRWREGERKTKREGEKRERQRHRDRDTDTDRDTETQTETEISKYFTNEFYHPSPLCPHFAINPLPLSAPLGQPEVRLDSHPGPCELALCDGLQCSPRPKAAEVTAKGCGAQRCCRGGDRGSDG